MSRAFQIRIAASLAHHTKVDEGIEARLEVLDVLGPERTGALLAEALQQAGWTVQEGVATRHLGGAGVHVEVDTAAQRIRLRATVDEVHELEVQRTLTVYEEDAGQRRVRAQADAEREVRREAEERDLQAQKSVAEGLEDVLLELTPELRRISDAVTRTALKERAAQLGEIVDIAENPESGELTIRVKV